MAKAYKPPTNGSSPRRYVSRHAVERLRGRAEAATHLDDAALERVLDDAVEAADRDGARSHRFVDSDGTEATLLEVGPSLDGLTARGEVWALLKPNYSKLSPLAEAVVTVLGPGAAASIRRGESPLPPSAPGGGGEPFNPALADALRGVALPPAPAAPDLPPESPAEPPRPLAGERVYFVLGRGEHLGGPYDRAEALEALRREPDAVLLRRVPFRVGIELEEE